MNSLLALLRHNIAVESDVTLAKAELASLCDVPVTRIRELRSSSALKEWLDAHLSCSDGLEYRFIWDAPRRREGTCALVLEDAQRADFDRILTHAAFVQDGVIRCDPSGQFADTPLARMLSRVRRVGNVQLGYGVPLVTILEYSAPLVFRSEQVENLTAALNALLHHLLDEEPVSGELGRHLHDAILAKKTTLYLTHELHLYKGKFFPRLAHSLINRYGPTKQTGTICDPFAGSGTALLESALLGFDSIGLDVDPTSVLISSHKTSLATVDVDEVRCVAAAMQRAVGNRQGALFGAFETGGWEARKIEVPEPMRSRLAKRGREEGYDLLGDIERDSAIVLHLIAQAPTHLQSIFRVCLSHALTKKLRLRFVGIGNGRFTFDVAKVGVLELFIKKTGHVAAIAEAFAWLKRSGVRLGTVQTVRGSALDLPMFCNPGSIDLVLTSPPYIPASSGREHYARARAIPLVVTGAATIEELEQLDSEFIGEMSADVDAEESLSTMPQAVGNTLAFLRDDEQRRPKFLPTLQYYVDLRDVLAHVNESLSPEGKAVFVVAKSHTFYIHKTKQILHTVDSPRALCEVAEQAGLGIADVIDVPLAKSGGLNARPRSTDEYAETVVVFRKGITAGSKARKPGTLATTT